MRSRRHHSSRRPKPSFGHYPTPIRRTKPLLAHLRSLAEATGVFLLFGRSLTRLAEAPPTRSVEHLPRRHSHPRSSSATTSASARSINLRPKQSITQTSRPKPPIDAGTSSKPKARITFGSSSIIFDQHPNHQPKAGITSATPSTIIRRSSGAASPLRRHLCLTPKRPLEASASLGQPPPPAQAPPCSKALRAI